MRTLNYQINPTFERELAYLGWTDKKIFSVTGFYCGGHRHFVTGSNKERIIEPPEQDDIDTKSLAAGKMAGITESPEQDDIDTNNRLSEGGAEAPKIEKQTSLPLGQKRRAPLSASQTKAQPASRALNKPKSRKNNRVGGCI